MGFFPFTRFWLKNKRKTSECSFRSHDDHCCESLIPRMQMSEGVEWTSEDANSTSANKIAISVEWRRLYSLSI